MNIKRPFTPFRVKRSFPLIEPVRWDERSLMEYHAAPDWLIKNAIVARIDQFIANARVFTPYRDKPPLHKLQLAAPLILDNHRHNLPWCHIVVFGNMLRHRREVKAPC